MCSYEVKAQPQPGEVEAATVNAMEIVRVGSFREVNRTGREHHLPALFSCAAVPIDSADGADVAGSRVRPAGYGSRSLRSEQERLSTPLLVYEATGRSTLDSAPGRSRALDRVRSLVATARGYLCRSLWSGSSPARQFVVRTIRERSCGATRSRLARRGALFRCSERVSPRWGCIAQVSFTRRTHTTVWRLHCRELADIRLMSFEDMMV